MALHILQLGPYPPPEGGVSRNMLAIRDAVLDGGHRCSIIAISRSASVTPERDVYHPASAIALCKLLSTIKFDLLHLHIGGKVNLRVLCLAAAATVFGRGKCLLTLHSGEYPLSDKGKSAEPNSIRGRIFRRFTRIIAVNEQIADVFRRYGVRADRIKVILPYALERPNASVAVPEMLSSFCKAHSPLLVAVGGLERDYDPLFQVNALGSVKEAFPNAGLVIVGDGSMRNEVEKAVEASGYGDSICVARNVDHTVTLHLINDADVFLRTTLFDGDSISVREALFLGTPVIATDNGMRPAGVDLIRIGDTPAFVKLVRKLASDGKKRPPQKMDDKANIDSVLHLYAELTESPQQ